MKERDIKVQRDIISRRDLLNPARVISSLPDTAVRDIRDAEDMKERKGRWMHGGGIAAFQEFVRSSEGERILREGRDKEIARLLFGTPFETTPGMLKNTPYDLERAFPVFPALQLVRHDYRVNIGRAMDRVPLRGPSGNGCAVTPRTLLTAKHVAEELGLLILGAKDDVAFVDIPRNVPLLELPRREELVQIPNDIRNKDLRGRLSVVMGVHDRGKHLAWRKKFWAYPSFPVTPRLRIFLVTYGRKWYMGDNSEEKNLGTSFVTVLPFGEIKRKIFIPPSALGMSGAPVFGAFQDNSKDAVRYQLTGVISGAFMLNFEEREYDIGCYRPINDIQDAMSDVVKGRLSHGV